MNGSYAYPLPQVNFAMTPIVENAILTDDLRF